MAAVAQHGDSIAKPEDFLHPMGNVDDGDTTFLEVSQQMKQVFAFVDRERAGRFVHDDDLRVGAGGGGDLDDLFQAGRKLANRTVHIDLRLDLAQHGTGALAHFRPIDPAGTTRQVAEAKVLPDGQVGAEGEFLVHHCNTQLAGDERVRRVNWFSVQIDISLIGSVNAREDSTERAFTSAVFADQRMATATFDFEAHPVERLHAGKTL